MRKLALILLISLASSMTSTALSWKNVQEDPEYLAAKKFLADYLPDLAIPRIKELLSRSELEKAAEASLLALLGEAEVRAGFPGSALKTLDHPELREFSPAHLWRSYALVQLGRYRDAIGELEKIDRQTMLENANLQIGKLRLSLGDLQGAREKLEPLLGAKSSSILKEATLQLVSVALSQDRLEEGSELLKKVTPSNPSEESLSRYLDGRLQLAQGNRLPAVGAFQTLLNDAEILKSLPAVLLHESTLALADSLALGGNETSAVNSLLETLEKHPDSPKLDEIFKRLRIWVEKIDPAVLLAKLESWTPPPARARPVPGIGEDDSAQAVNPGSPSPAPTLRNFHALGFLSGFHLRSDDPAQRKKGKLQALQLQLLSPPDSPLVNRSLLELGVFEMKESRHQQALTIFSLLAESNAPPVVRAYAKALAAKTNFTLEDPTKASQLFLEAGEIARDINESTLGSLTAINAGITLLTTSRSKELDEITKNLDSPEARSFLVLERGLFLSSKRDPAARDFLLSFLADFPNNPRMPEASLALAESAVFTPPFDRDLAKEHISPLKFDLESQPTLFARRLLVLLALNKGTQQAQDFLNRAPDHPLAARVLFQLGQTFRDPTREGEQEIGKANYQFELLLEKYPESEFADAARYFSALTSITLKTESADKNAVLRLRELIAQEGPLANEAAINLCSLLIDRDKQETALIEISRFLEDDKLPESDCRRFLILGADASNQIGQHERAIEFHQKLLKIKDLPVSTRNRANYIRGQALEKLGRTVEALEAYYEVVNRNFDPASATTLEWKWFDKCGIEGALALLEKEERWKAAIQLAEKIGRSGSPRAKDAREIAERIGLEQFIYRARTPATEDADKK